MTKPLPPRFYVGPYGRQWAVYDSLEQPDRPVGAAPRTLDRAQRSADYLSRVWRRAEAHRLRHTSREGAPYREDRNPELST